LGVRLTSRRNTARTVSGDELDDEEQQPPRGSWRVLLSREAVAQTSRKPGRQLGTGQQWSDRPGPVRTVYEAGPTGFGLARAARASGIEMMVCSPGAIPRQPGDRIKTDTRDALKLARLHAAGQLRPVVVPAPELEALRDLVRAREDLRGDLMSARHRISKLLLRRGLVWGGPGEAWAQRHLQWLSTIAF
jgi:transposase